MDKPTPQKSKLTLYANLLNTPDGASGATISSAPVLYKNAEDGQGEDSAQKKADSAAFRFQPGSIKRPQQNLQKQKKKPQQGFKSSSSLPTSGGIPSSDDRQPVAVAQGSTPAQQRTTYSLADWMDQDDDVNEFYDQKRPRKKKRKNKGPEAPKEVNWDDFYNIREWTNLEQWKTSYARVEKHQQWKAALKSSRRDKRESSHSDRSSSPPRRQMPGQFAPPSSLSFAPPKDLDTTSEPPKDRDDEDMDIDKAADEEVYQRRLRMTQAQAVDLPPIAVPNDPSGEDAYLRRLQLAQQGLPAISALQPPPPPPPPPPSDTPMSEDLPPPPPSSSSLQPPPPPPPSTTPSGTISRAPIRYSLPDAPSTLPSSDADLRRLIDAEAMDLDEEEEEEEGDEPVGNTKRPGQRNFAERHMARLGYKKGQGLGVSGTGITTALAVQKAKAKRRPDAEGGGLVNKVAMGKIIGGRKGKAAREAEEGEFGRMSRVVRLDGMTEGMDLARELGEGSLVEDIGIECGNKYGTVERVYVPRTSEQPSPPVFVKFVSELSGLRAVQALNGRTFAGNVIKARYWDEERFEKGDLD